jgi:phytanoyl-CoA hydroxylase
MTDTDRDTQGLRRDFERDGFVSLPSFLTPDEILEVNAETRRFIEGTVPTLPAEFVYHEDKDDPRTLKQVQRLQEHDRYFGSMMFGSRFERLARTLLGEGVVGKNMQYFNKPASIGQPTPPHQDGYFFMLEPNHALTMWLALEDVTEEQGCVRYVRGSHKRGMRPHGRSGVLGFSQHILDFGTQEDREGEVAFPCEAGHLIAHHSLTVHWADGNASKDRSREALGFIYHGESAREDEAAQAEYQRRLATELAAQGKI